MDCRAVFSSCRRYRFALWRHWHKGGPQVLFVGLNPSTADESRDDPTIRRCIGFAERWGYGGVCVANLFAYRATHTRDLLQARDPVGPGNDKWLVRLLVEADLAVAAWGNLGRYRGRSSQVLAMLPGLHCLQLNKTGEPAHPLYLRGDRKPYRLAQSFETRKRG